MPSNSAFLLSMYLTLILGCVTLGYSEFDYLPEVSAFTGVVAVLMVVAFLMDLRGRHLPLNRANQMGLAIFGVTAVWIYTHYRQADSLLHTLPWPAGSLPYIAPLLMVLVPAKLFRPKHVGDWWALQAMTLCGVGLAVSLAEDLACVVLVLIYSISAVWSLTLFYLYRAAGKITPYPAKPVESGWRAWMNPIFWFPAMAPRTDTTALAAAFEGLGPPSPAERLGRSHFLRSLGWIAAAALLATPLFLLTPRFHGMHWELFAARMETGYSPEGAPDLSRTGQLKPSKEAAFEVTVTRDGTPVDALPDEMRWRGTGFAEYLSPRGRWQRVSNNNNPIYRVSPEKMVLPQPARLEFPSFGPDTWMYDFRIIGKTGGPVFADPVAFRVGERAPMAIPFRQGGVFNYAVQAWDASFILLQGRNPSLISRVIQANRSPLSEDRTPVGTFTLNDGDPESIHHFLGTPPTEVILYANRLIEKMFTEGTLGPNIRKRWTQHDRRLHVQDHAAVAAAFTEHFSNGNFGYSLDLRRQDRNLDPIEDFLLNTRQGHCERFASALVLMLRAVEIPSQLVTGYRGAEPIERGRYIVRQDHAHAWAEVLLRVPGPNVNQWHWQAYDPTPAFSGPLDGETSGLIDSSTQQGKRLLTEYIVGLNPDSQKRLNEGLSDFFETKGLFVLLAVATIAVAILFLRRLVRKPAPVDVATDEMKSLALYSAWLNRLGTMGYAKGPAETPAEHAKRIGNMLMTVPALAMHADIPLRVAAILDRVRYAGEAVPDFEIDEMEKIAINFGVR